MSIWYIHVYVSYSDPPVGGYDYEFVGSIPSRYLCTICMKVLRDARLTECCGQHYCDSCLAQWLQQQKRKKTCPHCRKANLQSMINKEKIREINELCILCTNRKNGCEWVSELGALKGHLESDKGCGYEIVRCTNYGYRFGDKEQCEVAIERRAIAAHMKNQCIYRPYKCEYCGLTDTFDTIAGSGKVTMNIILSFMVLSSQRKNHYAECGHYPLPCPNECGVRNIKRKNIETHCGICPLEPLDCPFKDAGCTDKICRRDMENHIESSTQKHLLMVFKSHQDLARKNKELINELKKLRKSHQDLTRKNKELSNELKKLRACMQSDVEDWKDDVGEWKGGWNDDVEDWM